MVPCQPRQLVILSLPFAALVAFFWYKRKKSLSRSDPGGTSAISKPVDKSDSVSEADKIEEFYCTKIIENTNCAQQETELFNQRVEDLVHSTPKSEKIVEEPILFPVSEKIVSKATIDNKGSEIVTKPLVIAETNKSIVRIPCVNKEELACNGFAIHTKDEPEVNQPTIADSKTSEVIHSSCIEDNKGIILPVLKEAEQHFSVEEKPVEVCDPQKLHSVDKTEKNYENEVDDKTLTEHIYAELLGEPLIKKQASIEAIPFGAKNTEENIVFKIKPVLQDLNKSTTDKFSESTSLFENTVQGDPNSEETQNSNIKLVEKPESVPIEVACCSSSRMAQGQKTSEKQNEGEVAGLEQKLVSLGLDTQQPTQRDSANHSPAEVMLNSPAISTFSDVHSEGSSDSGKGCSDVVTPPSRTPAGGSSVAGDQVPSIYEFVLPQVIVGRLIGRHGTFLHDIRAKTHTNVFIKRHPETNNLKVCAIEGTLQDIDAALKMIRQKFPLRRFPDLTLARVSFVKNSLPITPENMQLHLVEGVNNDVILSSLITAGHFFLQLPMHLTYQSLYRLACVMNTVYNNEESPPLPDPRPDVVCVAPAHGGWYRAQILSIDEDNNTSDIRFLDYGGFVTVDNSTLRQIRGDFLLLPFQAVECALANVVPAGGEEEWSEEAKQFVQMMTTQQMLQAQVYDYTDTGLPLVYLYCTQFYQSPADQSVLESRVVLLNQELVTRGFAELIEAWQDETQPVATESS